MVAAVELATTTCSCMPSFVSDSAERSNVLHPAVVRTSPSTDEPVALSSREVLELMNGGGAGASSPAIISLNGTPLKNACSETWKGAYVVCVCVVQVRSRGKGGRNGKRVWGTGISMGRSTRASGGNHPFQSVTPAPTVCMLTPALCSTNLRDATASQSLFGLALKKVEDALLCTIANFVLVARQRNGPLANASEHVRLRRSPVSERVVACEHNIHHHALHIEAQIDDGV